MIKPGTKVRKTKCATCVFRSEHEGGIQLAPGRREEIQRHCINGLNQLCHHENDHMICRGGRDFTLQIWFRLGLIAAATDAALEQAMREKGLR